MPLQVWVKIDDQWLAAELRSTVDAASSTVTAHIERSGQTLSIDAYSVAPSNPKLQEGIPDLTHLSYLNEPGILYNLQYRYQEDSIYTFAGPVLIALNPCKPLPLYTRDMANAYKAAARDTVHGLDPHIYLVAANAFRKMLREKSSQSLIVNGDTGGVARTFLTVKMRRCDLWILLKVEKTLNCLLSFSLYFPFLTTLKESLGLVRPRPPRRPCSTSPLWQAVQVWRTRFLRPIRCWRPSATPRRFETTTAVGLGSLSRYTSTNPAGSAARESRHTS